MVGNPARGRRLRATLDPAKGTVAGGAGLDTPLAHGRLRGCQAMLGGTIFEIAQAGTEATVRPPGMTDDGRWEAVTSVPGFHQSMAEGQH